MSQLINEMANDEKVNDYLKKLSDDIKKNPPKDKNKGYENLMQDLTELLYNSYNYEFDDFQNTKYAAPKVELRNKLFTLAKNVENGKYDN